MYMKTGELDEDEKSSSKNRIWQWTLIPAVIGVMHVVC
jgi:hypothetical protein